MYFSILRLAADFDPKMRVCISLERVYKYLHAANGIEQGFFFSFLRAQIHLPVLTWPCIDLEFVTASYRNSIVFARLLTCLDSSSVGFSVARAAVPRRPKSWIHVIGNPDPTPWFTTYRAQFMDSLRFSQFVSKPTVREWPPPWRRPKPAMVKVGPRLTFTFNSGLGGCRNSSTTPSP